MIANQNFQILGEATISENGTLHLGNNAVVQRYRILINTDRQLLLDPSLSLADREQWLWQNSDAIAAVKTGIIQAGQGKTQSLGSFA
jgi:hypothetical protein